MLHFLAGFRSKRGAFFVQKPYYKSIPTVNNTYIPSDMRAALFVRYSAKRETLTTPTQILLAAHSHPLYKNPNELLTHLFFFFFSFRFCLLPHPIHTLPYSPQYLPTQSTTPFPIPNTPSTPPNPFLFFLRKIKPALI